MHQFIIDLNSSLMYVNHEVLNLNLKLCNLDSMSIEYLHKLKLTNEISLKVL